MVQGISGGGGAGISSGISGLVEVSSYTQLMNAINNSSVAGKKEIRIIKPFALTGQVLVDTIDNFCLTGLGRYTTLTLGAGATGQDAILIRDSNDVYLDNFGLNCAGQTVGDGLSLLRVRRSAIGPTFLRIDNAFRWGIMNNGSGAYPNSNVVNVFGNIFIYTCGNMAADATPYSGGFYEGENSGDDRIFSLYVQESIGYNMLIRGTHLQGGMIHCHEANQITDTTRGVNMAIWTHACDLRSVNLEGSDRNSLELGFAGGSANAGARNHIGFLYSFDNNQQSVATACDVQCLDVNVINNTIDYLLTDGATRCKYNFDDGAADASVGHANTIGTHVYKGAVTAATRLGTGSAVDHSRAW